MFLLSKHFEVSSCVHRTFIAFVFVFLRCFPAGPSSHLQAQAKQEKEEKDKRERAAEAGASNKHCIIYSNI